MTFEQLEHEYARLFREVARLRAAAREFLNCQTDENHRALERTLNEQDK